MPKRLRSWPEVGQCTVLRNRNLNPILFMLKTYHFCVYSELHQLLIWQRCPPQKAFIQISIVINLLLSKGIIGQMLKGRTPFPIFFCFPNNLQKVTNIPMSKNIGNYVAEENCADSNFQNRLSNVGLKGQCRVDTWLSQKSASGF